MKFMSILKLLASDSFWALNKPLSRETDVETALFFAELASAQNYWNEKQQSSHVWFYRTRDKIQEETTLSSKIQRRCEKTLKSFGLLKMKLKGLPATNHYIIDDECQQNLLNLISSEGISRCDKREHLDSDKKKHQEATESNTKKEYIRKNKKERIKKLSKEKNFPIWLSDFYKENDIEFLLNFEKQPSENWLRKKIQELSEEKVKKNFLNIEKYCSENPTFSESRKILASVFTKFQESLKSGLEEKAEQVISKKYEDLFEENYQFSIACSRNLKGLLAKIKKSLSKYLKKKLEQVEDDELINALSSFFNSLPEKYQKASQFKVSLINHNYQSIKNEIKSAHNKKKSKSTNSSSQGIGSVNKYGI